MVLLLTALAVLAASLVISPAGATTPTTAPVTSTTSTTPNLTPSSTPGADAGRVSISSVQTDVVAECGDMAPVAGAARPTDLARRYGLTALHEAGDDGRGITAAVLQFGMSVDEPKFHLFQRCIGIAETPFTQSLWEGTGPVVVPWVDPKPAVLPDPGREAQSDVDVLTSTAVGLEHLYALVSPSVGSGDAYYRRLTAMIDSLRTGAATGGRRPDVVSFSYGVCEAQLSPITPSVLDDLDRAMRELADAGTWFFKGSGDSGSSDCLPRSDANACQGDASPSAHFPATSPYVTAVGGLTIPTADRVVLGGIARIWNESPTGCSGGGGGISTRYDRPSFQQHVPGSLADTGVVTAKRTIPDIAALAGGPGFATLLPPDAPGGRWSWVANGGDSLSGPMCAGSFASMLTALHRRGIEPPTHLNDMLYEIANDPVLYAKVFRDVTVGDNATVAANRPPNAYAYPATVGYDLASGLGEVHIGEVLAVLEARVTPHFTG